MTDLQTRILEIEANDDTGSLARALEAVLELHWDLGGGECNVCADAYGPKPMPCPTVQAITEALGSSKGSS